MTRQDFITELKELVAIINNSVPTEDNDLYDFVCEEVIDRVVAYLNYYSIDELELYDKLLPIKRIIARVISSIYTKSKADQESGEVEQGINAMSDNGQSINFSDKVKLYLNTSSDQDIFSGFTDLLNPYRLANVL